MMLAASVRRVDPDLLRDARSGLLLAAPLFYMVAGSLMSNEQLSIQPPQVIPSSLHFENYSDAFSGSRR